MSTLMPSTYCVRVDVGVTLATQQEQHLNKIFFVSEPQLYLNWLSPQDTRRADRTLP